VTVQPGQTLALLNGDFTNAAAVKLGDRVVVEVGDDPRQQIEHAIQLALNRPAGDDEAAEGLALVSSLQQKYGLSPRKALDQWCLTVLNLSEFIYLD
jgi:hypothetical protein